MGDDARDSEQPEQGAGDAKDRAKPQKRNLGTCASRSITLRAKRKAGTRGAHERC